MDEGLIDELLKRRIRDEERDAVLRYLRAEGFRHDHSPDVWELIEAIKRGAHR